MEVVIGGRAMVRSLVFLSTCFRERGKWSENGSLVALTLATTTLCSFVFSRCEDERELSCCGALTVPESRLPQLCKCALYGAKCSVEKEDRSYIEGDCVILSRIIARYFPRGHDSTLIPSFKEDWSCRELEHQSASASDGPIRLTLVYAESMGVPT